MLGEAMAQARSVLMEERVMLLTAREIAQVGEALDRETRVIPELAAPIREVKGQQVRDPGPRCPGPARSDER